MGDSKWVGLVVGQGECEAKQRKARRRAQTAEGPARDADQVLRQLQGVAPQGPPGAGTTSAQDFGEAMDVRPDLSAWMAAEGGPVKDALGPAIGLAIGHPTSVRTAHFLEPKQPTIE